jgi:SPP1 family holin
MKKETAIRLALLIAALINQALVTLGYEALPWSGDDVGEAVSTLITAGTAAWAYWKNNSHTPAAIEADKVMGLIRAGAVTAEEAFNAVADAAVIVPEGGRRPEVAHADVNGEAPEGLAVGDFVQTANGRYQITHVNPDGSYRSKKV